MNWQNQGFNLEHLALSKVALDAVADGVMIVDARGAIQLANLSAVRFLGVTKEQDAVGIDFVSLLRLETADGILIGPEENPIRKAVELGQNFSSREYRLVDTAGRRVAVELTVRTLGAGRMIGFRDVEKEKKESAAQSDFISTASHEMRTPVASIEGYLGLALNPQTATIDERARKYLEQAHKASQHLGRLFQDLLDTTKLDDHKMRLRMEPMEVRGAVLEILEGLSPIVQAKGLYFKVDEGDGGGGLTIRPLLYGMVDGGFLRESLSNLVENAVKYTEQGGVTVRIDGDEGRIIIQVIDTGIGIRSEDIRHIFQKFYRVDNSATRTIGGTGLGLYLVKGRIEAMGGKVVVESMLGKGSTFSIILPRLSEAQFNQQRLAFLNTQQWQMMNQTSQNNDKIN